jgi:hypothetical protein
MLSPDSAGHSGEVFVVHCISSPSDAAVTARRLTAGQPALQDFTHEKSLVLIKEICIYVAYITQMRD